MGGALFRLWSGVWGLSGSVVRPRFLVNGYEKRPNPWVRPEACVSEYGIV